MSISIEERIIKSKERTAKLEEQRRISERQEREKKKKKDQQRNYVIGELVSKYFPEVLNLEPGCKANNAVEFDLFESLLSVLSHNQEYIDKLKKEAQRELNLKNRIANL